MLKGITKFMYIQYAKRSLCQSPNNTKQKEPYLKCGDGTGKLTLYFLSLLIVLAGAGSIYQWFGVREDLKSYKPVGRLYDVFGHKMHLYTEGQGATTVVFAAGWGTANAYVDFYPLYKGLSSQVKIAVYDRFGYGYSDTTGKKRDLDSITDEMHELFRVSGQKPPSILVGHSLFSLETIRYAQRFPKEVAGIVLVEGGSRNITHRANR